MTYSSIKVTRLSPHIGAEIGNIVVAQRRDFFRFEAERSLEPRERKVGIGASRHRPWQVKALTVAARGFLLDERPARITEAEKLGRLVESLADGVIDGAAKPQVIADPANTENLGVAARGQKQAIRKGGAICQARGQRMRFEVVDREQRLVMRERNSLRGGQPDDDAADQAGAGGGGNAVECAE